MTKRIGFRAEDELTEEEAREVEKFDPPRLFHDELSDADIRLTDVKNAVREIYTIVSQKLTYYGPNTIEKGQAIMQNLFPDGIPVSKYPDALIIIRVIDKLCRLAESPESIKDAWCDISGYGIRRVASMSREKE